MNKNVGGIDKLLRIIVGVVLIVLAITGTIGWWGYLGIILLATGLLSVCPIYSILGVKTACPLDKNN